MKKAVLCLFIASAVMIGGCSEYHADIPEFTVHSERDSGFVPKSGESVAGSEDTRDLDKKIREGFEEVEKKFRENRESQ